MRDLVSVNVEFPSKGEGRSTTGFLARPADSNKYAGVIVIHAIWGLVDFIREVTSRFAREGCVALAPDLFNGKTASSLEEGLMIKREFSEGKFLGDLMGAVAYLKNHKFVYRSKIGSVGFCMGGTLSLLLACRDIIDACVVFYGWNPRPMALLKNLSCPMLGNYGGADTRIPQEHIISLKETLTKYGKTFDIKIYPGAPHAFFNETLPAYRYNEAKDAWKRTLKHFEKYLKDK